MKLRSRIMLALLTVVSAQAYSQEQDSGEAGAIADAETAFLFINLLEFMGEFETEDGEWISPDILGNEAFADLDGSGGNSAGTVDTSTREQRILSATGDDE